MTKRNDSEFSREAVAVFHSAKTMQGAIDELLQSGFDRAELNILADSNAIEEKLGHHYSKNKDAEDEPNAPRTAYVSPEAYGGAEGAVLGALIYVPACIGVATIVASGGTVAAAATAAIAAGGAGGVVGSVLATLIGERHAKNIKKQLASGGLVLWVLTSSEEKEARAVEILTDHAGEDVHVHGIRLTKAIQVED